MSALLSAPWTRAPLLLLRRPVVFVAIAVATAVLAVAAASGVLFLSTVGTASLQVQAAADCPELSRPAFEADVPSDRLAADDAAGLAAMRSASGTSAYSAAISTARIQSSPVDLYSRPGALDHVSKLTPDDGVEPGALAARQLRDQDRGQARTDDHHHRWRDDPRRRHYRALAPIPTRSRSLPRYWCTSARPDRAEGAREPGRPVADCRRRYRRGRGIEQRRCRVVRRPLAVHCAVAGRERPGSGARGRGDLRHPDIDYPYLHPDLNTKIDTAQRVRAGLRGSVVPIDLAGVLVAALLVAGAGGFWATARAREIRLLVARGVGPGALAAKAVLETLPAALVGLVGDFVAALLLIRGIGPTSVLEPGAPLRAFGLAALAVAGALLIIAVIGLLAGRERVTGGRTSWVRRVPWELALLAVGIWTAARLRSASAVTIDHAVIRVDPLTFVFPLLAATAVLLLLARLTAYLLPRLGRVQPRRNANYLAVRRLAGSRAVVVGVLIGTALPCGLLTYASSVTHGVSSNVTAKYRTNLGAQHVLEVRGSLTGTPRLDGHGTPVAVIQSQATLADNTQVNILGVDPATFAAFADTSSQQRAAVSKIDYRNSDDVPALLVNAPSSADATTVTVGATQLNLAVQSRLAVFPGLRDSFEPMIVIDRSAFTLIDQNADRDNQVWTTNADYAAAQRAIAADGYNVLTELTSQVLMATPACCR